MSEPEISRRCTFCGASIRGRAAFCPQCGDPLNRRAAHGNAGIEFPATRLREVDQELSASAARPVSDTGGAAATNGDGPAPRSESVAEDEDARSHTSAVAKSIAGTEKPLKRHRVTAAARDAVEDNLRPRVEKLRQASTVVLDEAADDPSLRFVLVAAVIFLLFIVLLLMSLLG